MSKCLCHIALMDCCSAVMPTKTTAASQTRVKLRKINDTDTQIFSFRLLQLTRRLPHNIMSRLHTNIHHAAIRRGLLTDILSE